MSNVDKVQSTQAKRSGRTLADEIYEILLNDILTGVLTPGMRLSPTALSKQRNVSSTVIREALTRLVAAGLVQSQSQQGFAVTSISAEDLEDLTNMRKLVDCEGLRLSIKKGGLGWQSQVLAAHHTLANTPDTQKGQKIPSEEYQLAHAAFHESLVAGCGSPRLIAQSKALYTASILYRRISRPLNKASRASVEEHKAIMDAALSGDETLATDLLAQHYERTLDILMHSDLLEKTSGV